MCCSIAAHSNWLRPAVFVAFSRIGMMGSDDWHAPQAHSSHDQALPLTVGACHKRVLGIETRHRLFLSASCGCREASLSVCSGSSLRSSTWLTQPPWPSCWRRKRRRMVCTATTSAFRRGRQISPFSGTLVLFSAVICSSSGNNTCPQHPVSVNPATHHRCSVWFSGGSALGPERRYWDGSFQRLSSAPYWTARGPSCSAAWSLTVQTPRARSGHWAILLGFYFENQLNTWKWSDISTEYWIDVAFQGVGVFGWLVVGEGLPTVRVLPVQHCQKHCSSFNLWLTPGDMGRDASVPHYEYLNLCTWRHQMQLLGLFFSTNVPLLKKYFSACFPIIGVNKWGVANCGPLSKKWQYILLGYMS